MRVAIIGAGNVGSAIARASSATGNDVVITAEDIDQAKAVADRFGISLAQSTGEVVRDADLVVLAVPYAAVRSVAAELADKVPGKPIIDASNPMTPDGSGLAVTTRSGAEELQALLPEASVVKAFNTVFATNQADPVVDGLDLDGFYAGDDEAAKAVVAGLLKSIGYRPIDAGGLTAARALEHMAFLNISLNARSGWSWRSAWKLIGPLE